ncbi:MAG TPA: YnbE family lipoprotein [Chromatiaceae bacterium]|nr:YnbE family lipoprotein [Chromatiaceae bacterium]HIN81945.1 YnbE family lipoprotein [Chromatiales bacterium]HIA08395.1 YnbE family lipoprotein [Chromatiaceae bacterium]HIB83422.1 YnbE family lipoprotein [Chromatiaceae bacterium]HIO14575.1 YnbE family lipoprotein [Chromatiales bacterium]
MLRFQAQTLLALLVGGLLLAGCSPTVKVVVPDKPIEINLNINIQHEIRVKVDKEIDDLIAEDSGLF